MGRKKRASDDLLQITTDTQNINVAQHLFDYIGLAVPMKKLHPRYAGRRRRRDRTKKAR